MAWLSPTRRLMGEFFRILRLDSKCQSPISVWRLRGRMDSRPANRAPFAPAPAFLKAGADRSSKIHLQYLLRCKLAESAFLGDTSDPTRRCDRGPPSFDQKTINELAECEPVQASSGREGRRSRGHEVGIRGPGFGGAMPISALKVPRGGFRGMQKVCNFRRNVLKYKHSHSS